MGGDGLCWVGMGGVGGGTSLRATAMARLIHLSAEEGGGGGINERNAGGKGGREGEREGERGRERDRW